MSRIVIEVYFLPYEWQDSAQGELKCVQLDSFLEIDPKQWDFASQRPTKEFSEQNNYFHDFMIEVQIRKAQESFDELVELMIEGQLCEAAIEALYMEPTRHWTSYI